MNWFDLVPNQVARNQIAWERRHRVAVARATGAAPYRVIAAAMGISTTRVQQFAQRFERQPVAPVLRWLANDEDVRAMAMQIKRRGTLLAKRRPGPPDQLPPTAGMILPW